MEAALEAGQRRRKTVSEGDEGLRTGESLEVELNPNVAGGNCLGRTERAAERLGSEMASEERLGLKPVSMDGLDCETERKLGFVFTNP